MSVAIAIRSDDFTPRVLTPDEAAEFAALEADIQADIKAAMRCAARLQEVHRAKYYLSSHPTFEAYLQGKWGISRIHGHRLVAAANVADNLLAAGLPAPEGESQVRPLVRLAPETQREAWAEATRETPRPTARQVEDAVAKIAPGVSRQESRGMAAESRPEPVGENISDPVSPRGGTAEAEALPGDMAAHNAKGPRKLKPPKFDAPAEEQVAYARAAGIIPEGAEVYIDGAGDGPHEPREPSNTPEPTAELSDADWLATLPARERLAPHVRAWFDTEAVAFRRISEFRLKFRQLCKPVTNAAKRASRGHIGPYMDRHFYYLKMNGPERWLACVECKGTGQEPLIGKCAACRGHGYHV